VDSDTGHFTVSFRDESYDFAIKPRGTTTATGSLVIESLLPDPTDAVGPDTTFEEVTLKNKGTTTLSLTGWLLRDKSNLTWTLTGSVNAGESITIRRNGMPMSLNNNGDVITLVGPGNQSQDAFTYTSSQPGVVIQTGH
jgi:hypothetical protein